MAEKQVFLIQSSGKAAEHISIAFSDRTYADEVTRHGYYRHEGWDTKTRDQDFGKVKVGNYVLHYCTTDVESFPGCISERFREGVCYRIDYLLVSGNKPCFPRYASR